MTLALTSILAFIAACLLTGLIRHHAIAQGVLDHPNERSSHEVPTPRGGGLAIVTTSLLAGLALGLADLLELTLLAALLGGGLAVAAIGWLDDRQGLPARWRLLVHFAAAGWLVAWLGGAGFGAAWILLLPAVAWSINLYNFMDGIDGLAGVQALAAGLGGGLLLWAAAAPGLALVAFTLGGAAAGFLYWNWPPARIFMGDGGSGFIGFLFAALALASHASGATGLWAWLILGGVFIVDATATLLWRLAGRQPVWQAHRGHAYQRYARLVGSHRPVTLACLAIMLCWLLPLAWSSEQGVIAGGLALGLAWLPLLIAWFYAWRRLPAQ